VISLQKMLLPDHDALTGSMPASEKLDNRRADELAS